ncbi:metal ABC transporter substrate-binding protein [Clostridium folliculivorans]|uniref:Manganese ABC transporter substrate-binding protein n=1 Tax=Clostridium folliculivorans TaxID=2886038 RepID=A0A9W5XYN0_9CLOT|nr:zinc ABC transporter substrate-binding protein [Clostridium folliculivorans]GKU23348.1 manganese ABC transporter substrate-binding protein [Clostridium folliculivorans]GKU29465.1 manganese ABC transporter substrate-binding protein [Clostridium folliculivorans]
MKKFDMKKFTFVLIGINIIFFIFISTYYKPKVVNTINDDVEQRDTYLNIITTNKFIYSATKQLVKDKHNVTYMFNNNFDSLNFKFTNDSLDNVSKYDLLLYMGSSSEPWINGFIDGLKKGKVGIVNLSRGTKTLNYIKSQTVAGYDIKINPYYWLSPDEYKIMLYNIKSSIQDKDPKNRDFYEENYEEMISELDKDSKDVKDSVSVLSGYTVYTTDEDLDYLTKYLGIDVIKLTDLTKIDDYKKMLSGSVNKTLIVYSNQAKFNEFSSKITGTTYYQMEIKIPEYDEQYRSYLENISLKFKGLNKKL